MLKPRIAPIYLANLLSNMILNKISNPQKIDVVDKPINEYNINFLPLSFLFFDL